MLYTKTYLDYLLSHSEKWTHWIDYITLRYNRPLNIVKWLWAILDTNNSNLWWIDSELWNMYSLEKSSKWWVNYYRISVSCDIGWISLPIPIMRITHNCLDNKREKLSQYLHNINIYGSAFRLITMWYYSSVLGMLHNIFPEDFDIILEHSEITRLDYCLDLFFDLYSKLVPSRTKLVKGKKTLVINYSQYNEDNTLRTNQKSIQEDIETINAALEENNNWTLILNQDYSDWEYFTWRRVWNIKYKKSNIIRCYNKNTDSVAKWKALLYSDYLQHKVWRIETQFWYDFCISPNGEYYKLCQLEELVEKAMSFMSLNKIKQKYNYEKFTIPQNYFSRVIKWYKTTSTRLAKSGLNPFIIAEEWLYENGFQWRDIMNLRKKTYISKENQDTINDIVADIEY